MKTKEELEAERMNKLIEMTSTYDQCGWVDEKDIERINELDELILNYCKKVVDRSK